jgi:hypothetical protein
MKTSIDIRAIQESITDFFRRFHTILFFLMISAGLFIAILILLNIIELSSKAATGNTDKILSDFDQTTIDRVNSLGGRSASQPGDRSSPFVE